MNKRLLCIVLLPFAAGCFLRVRGNGLYVACIVLFFGYLMFPALSIKDVNKKKKELMLRAFVISLSFGAGLVRSSVELGVTEEKLGEIRDGDYTQKTCVITGEKSDGSVIYAGDFLVYSKDVSVFDKTGSGATSVKPGDTVTVEGKTYLFDRATNEGEFDSFEYYISQKIYYSISAEKITLTKRPVFSVARGMWDLKGRIREVYLRSLPKVQSALVCAMALGDKTMLDDELKDLYRVSGLSHILVISGLHISLIGLMLYRLLQGRTTIVTACVMAVLGLMFYGAVTGFSVSTVRAVTMFVMYLSAAALGCGYDGLSAWSIAMSGLLIFEPMALLGSGFVMSFYQTGFILCTAELGGRTYNREKTNARLEKDPVKKLRYRMTAMRTDILQAFKFTVIMTLSSYPLIACFYYELPVYSTVANFLLLPAMGLVMVSAVIGGAAGLFSLQAAKIFLFPVKVILGADTYVCEMVKKLPGAMKICGHPGNLRMILYFIIFSVVLIVLYRGRNLKFKTVFCAAGSLMLLTLLMFPHRLPFEMDFLDVGQGDGIFISSSEGIRFFIDGGSSSEKNVGKYTMMPFLKYKGVDSVDYWFLSHLDKDHVSGLSECLEDGFDIKNIVLSDSIVRDDAFDELMEKVSKTDTKLIYVRSGDSMVFSDTVIKILSPDDKMVTDDRNAKSLVFLYMDGKPVKGERKQDSDGGFSAFFGGDIGEEEEERILERGVAIDVDLYKASHHGSKYSNTEKLLDVLSPEISVVSCSLTNKYGHPGEEAIFNMQRAGSGIFYTMYSGRIRVIPHDGKIYVYDYSSKRKNMIGL